MSFIEKLSLGIMYHILINIKNLSCGLDICIKFMQKYLRFVQQEFNSLWYWVINSI